MRYFANCKHAHTALLSNEIEPFVLSGPAFLMKLLTRGYHHCWHEQLWEQTGLEMNQHGGKFNKFMDHFMLEKR